MKKADFGGLLKGWNKISFPFLIVRLVLSTGNIPDLSSF